ncbi:MAG TPA: aminoacyl-tRNA hydrolase [Acidimicrobiales bacterium]
MGADDLITPGGLRLAPAAVTWRVTRSGGPGGQHANTSDTAVTITVHLPDAGLSESDTARLVASFGATVTARSADSRSQWRNRQVAWERLAGRLDGASRPARARHPTRPSKAARAERLDTKRRRAGVKQARQRPNHDD